MDFKSGFNFDNILNPETFFSTLFTQYLGLAILLIVILFAVLAIYIYKGLQYGQMRFIVLENKNISVRKSMRVSIEYMKGHKGELFGLLFSFIGWFIICMSPVFFKSLIEKVLNPKVTELIISLSTTILSAFLVPYLTSARANFYIGVRDAALSSGKVKPEDLQ